MLGWLAGVLLLGFVPRPATVVAQEDHPYKDRIFMDRVVHLPRNFQIDNCRFIRCTIYAPNPFHSIACKMERCMVDYGSDAEVRPSAICCSFFADCDIVQLEE